MPTINFTRISGVITVTSDGTNPRSFFGGRGNFNANSAGNGFDIIVNGTPISVSLTDLRVNNQRPTTMTEGMSLLSAIFQ